MKWLILACALATPALADTPAKELFSAVGAASDQRSAPIGSYARGCLAGAVQLPETGPHGRRCGFRAIAISETRASSALLNGWGNPPPKSAGTVFMWVI